MKIRQWLQHKDQWCQNALFKAANGEVLTLQTRFSLDKYQIFREISEIRPFVARTCLMGAIALSYRQDYFNILTHQPSKIHSALLNEIEKLRKARKIPDYIHSIADFNDTREVLNNFSLLKQVIEAANV